MKIFIPLLCAGLFLSACKSTKNNNGTGPSHDVNKLEGTWELRYINSVASLQQLYPVSKPFIKFDVANKKISGRTGCNSFGGALVTKDSTIDFSGPIAMTRMFCQGQGEPVFTEKLYKVYTFNIQDSTLEFLAGDTLAMRFVKK
jgi:heat shock protein HslJ